MGYLIDSAIGTVLSGMLVTLLFFGCLWIGTKLGGRSREGSWRSLDDTRRPGAGLGVLLFFFLMVGVPLLIVLWGYATGRLPAR